MKKEWKMKGNKFGIVSEEAIMHMIGQTEDMRRVGNLDYPKCGVLLSEVAAWLNVSKPTAKRFLEKIEGVNEETRVWRYDKNNGRVHSKYKLYFLDAQTFAAYKQGIFYDNYRAYVYKMYN